jgi:hypothetical protein
MRLGHQLRAAAKDVFAPAVPRAAEKRAAPARAGRRWSLMTAVPWAAAAALALALFAQVRQPGLPAGADEMTAYVPVALRPASRGQLPEVNVPQSGSVALSLDVNIGAPGQAIAYRLAREDDSEAASGRAAVPPPGVPLVLTVPAERLRPAGTFVLTLTADGDGGPPAEYRFNAAER